MTTTFDDFADLDLFSSSYNPMLHQVLDEAEIRRALSLLVDPKAAFQLQAAPHWAFKTFAGTDLSGALAWVRTQHTATGIYYAINPVPAGLNRSLLVKDVLSRRWLFIDVDRFKTNENKSLSATEGEHAAAMELACEILDYLTRADWPPPLLVDSGNGYHLLYRIDTANDRLAQTHLRNFLAALAAHYDGARGSVGKECHDARRIAKLPGTLSRRGPASAERPHRPCRVLFVPEASEVLDPGLIVATTTALRGGKPAVATTPSARQSSADPSHAARWARKALEGECGRMALTKPGHLNDQLFRSAAALGNIVGAGLLDERTVFERLLAAARQAGADNPEKDTDTLRRGLAKGKEEPRHPPERNGTYQVPPPGGDEGEEPLTVCMAAVKPLKVEWLMPNRLPKRFISVLAGRTGIGKSFVALDIIARVTKGGEIPLGGGARFERGGALIISEDPHEYVLAPRLIEAGADMNLVRAMTWKAMGRFHLSDQQTLERACAEVEGPKVVMIDPPTNFLGDVDEHKNAEVRQTVMHIVEWLTRMDLVCLFILHVNKQSGPGVDALNRVMGSVAWVTTSRIAHGFTLDPDDPSRCLLVPLKNNLGPPGKALAYRVEKTEGLAQVKWLEEVDTAADDAMSGQRKKKSKREVAAADWLEEVFATVNELPSKELFGRKDAETTISKNALKEAKDLLGIQARRTTGPEGEQCWVWVWPPDARARWLERKAADMPPDSLGPLGS